MKKSMLTAALMLATLSAVAETDKLPQHPLPPAPKKDGKLAAEKRRKHQEKLARRARRAGHRLDGGSHGF